MRLAYLTTSYPEVSHTFIRREILGLEALGHEVERLSIRRPGSELVDPDDQAEVGRTWYCLPQLLRALPAALLVSPLRLLGALWMTLSMARTSHRGLVVNVVYLLEALVIARRLRARPVDHMHVHFGTNAATVARLVKRLGGPSYSMTIHGPAELDQTIGFSLGPKIEDAAFVVAITSYCSAQLRRWVDHEHWEKIRVVHCAVPESLLDRARPIDPESRRLVCVGRLSEQKGQLLLLDAFERVVAEGVDLQLVLAGDGEMRGEVETRIREHGLEDHVEVTGWIDANEVASQLARARALVLPSFAEGLPVVIMEAFAMARPVLSTYIAGIPELVRPEQNGWLVPAGDTAALADALRELMATPVETLDAFGRDGHAAVRDEHHLPTEVSRLEKIFREFVQP
jgi:glycosyltransferase involved in cell wall biosynthesis